MVAYSITPLPSVYGTGRVDVVMGVRLPTMGFAYLPVLKSAKIRFLSVMSQSTLSVVLSLLTLFGKVAR